MTTSVNSVRPETSQQLADRFFNGLGVTIVGPDQNYIGDDGRPVGTPPSVFTISNPNGLTTQVGVAQASALPGGGSGLPGVLLAGALGLAAWWFLSRRRKG